ncbi:MAG: sigma 54-interacting transcriptional regulator, partial [Gemmatimonadetes bacterium]|nr:sigma 54-interacting transcriptional regulator [Gemmatimonadota bacterium]
FTAADGLPHSVVKSMFQDHEHQFWFATWNGVGQYDAHSINVFDLRGDSFPNEVSQIAQDRRGDIWVGYASPHLGRQIKSLARFDGEHFTFVGRPEKGPGVGNCFSIYEDLEGHLWFGGGNGLFRYEEQKLKMRKLAADVDAGGICSITQDQEGRFIFGYWEHYALNKRKKLLASPLKIVYQQGEQRQTIFAEDDKKTPHSRIGRVLATRNNAIYFHLTSRDSSTSVIGFARWHPQEGLTWYGVEDGLIDNHVNDLLVDRHDNLWIATQGGLSCFDGRSFRSFTTKDGLPSNRIHCLFEDARGHLWIGTDKGVALYDGRLFQTIQSPHIGPVCRILEDRDGTFWLGTIVGSIIRYRPRQTPPLIRLIRVITDQVYENVEDVCLSTVGQQVIFEYKGLSFSTHPRDMLYVYRLQGHDADWGPATRELQACYQNLPPGDYTLQVRAIDRDFNYSEPAQAQLAVKPDAHIETLSATLRGDNKVVGPSKVLRQLQTKLTEVASSDLTVLIGQSETMRQLQTRLTEVAPTDLTVLILGETGVGKGLAARALHALSAYGNGPFIHVNCGTLSQAWGDSELFGREEETATSQVGKVEQAKDGTLFLDEIGEMTLETQDKVLRLLEERTFERVGSDQTQAAQTRIVAATSRDLKTMVQAGDFRENLYLRLQMFPLYIPPLREHKEDIPALVEFCKNRTAAHLGRPTASLSVEVMEMLHAYDWPGNVRELEHLIQQAVTTCKGGQIEVADLMQHGFNIVNAVLGLKGESQEREIMPLLELERSYILEVLNATNGQIKGKKGAAALLGVPPSTLYNKMRKLGIKRS